MNDQFESLKKEITEALARVSDAASLEPLRTAFLGRKGKLALLMKELVTLSAEERKAFGQLANDVKNALEDAFAQKEKTLTSQEAVERLQSEWIDVTQPPLCTVQFPNVGHLHPATQVREDLETFFSSMGFVIADGPELESEYYNFTALNIPPTHPARDMQDTFYVKDHPGYVMRTHT